MISAMKCKCSRLRRQLIRYGEDTLPDKLRAARDACPDCKRFFERTQLMRHLLALKNQEPSADYEQRCVQGVHRRLRTLLAEEAEKQRGWREIWLGPVPAFRFGVAALFVVFLGLHLMSSTPTPISEWTPQPGMRTLLEAPRSAPDLRMETGTRPSHEHINFTTASNGRPIEIRQPPPAYYQLINLEP